MNYLVGLLFVTVAIGIGMFGDRTIQREGGGIVSKAFGWTNSRASKTKWGIAATLVGVGLWFIFMGVQ